MKDFRYRIGFVLSGGGARGFAHLGFLEALNEAGIFPDVIAGTSAGAIAGVLYADGYTPKEILKMTNFTSRLDLLRPAIPREGLLQISGIAKILKTYLRAKTFSELKIPLYVTATDINNAKVVYFSEGDLIETVIASSSIPVVFPPVKIGKFNYVDGGVLDNLPVRAIENICQVKIGSFVNMVGYIEKISGLVSLAERTFMVGMSKELFEKAKKFDLFVAPDELKNYRVTDTMKAAEMFEIGYRSTKEKLKDFDLIKIFDKKLKPVKD
ncbi:MAG TPA: patatin-like phospholipase family protein [Bacteroidales bacterium]|jgi:NTE family protein|nr:patatin-like phospholipase family protein [Bacteroidales bacterium]